MKLEGANVVLLISGESDTEDVKEKLRSALENPFGAAAAPIMIRLVKAECIRIPENSFGVRYTFELYLSQQVVGG